MKGKIMKKTKTKEAPKREGLVEGLVAAALVVLCFVLAATIPSCDLFNRQPPVESGVLDDAVAPGDDTPTSSELNPITLEGVTLPVDMPGGIQLARLYTATGYFPEDGSDEKVEDVLVAAFTNTTDQTLEYMTATLTVNGKEYAFKLTTIPPKKSVYVFNDAAEQAPAQVTALDAAVGYQTFFAETPSVKADTLSFTCQTGTIVAKNISDKDIKSDIFVYYKSTAEGGYLGGITYRFRITGGLKAGESFNAYAPHAYAHMTEIMFVTYEE